jgi:hypothetical protein
MQAILPLFVGLLLHGQGAENAPAKRYDIAPDLKAYAQTSAKETLASVLKAIEAKRIDYILAQLADPEWVDRRVQMNGGSFATLVEESTGKLVGDPVAAKRLRKYLSDGQWETVGASASAHLKDVDEEALYFRNVDGRWFLENRKK